MKSILVSMKTHLLILYVCLSVCSIFPLRATDVNPDLLHKPWKASWISVPGETRGQYGVYEFQKEIVLKEVPDTYILHLSADNRYKFFVNGEWVSAGPSSGDLEHWYFNTIDITPYLHAGNNRLSAVVWNDGNERAIHQFSAQTAFIVQGNEKGAYAANTNAGWQCRKLFAHHPQKQTLYGYFALGPGEFVDFNRGAGNWQTPIILGAGMPKGVATTLYSDWGLVPSGIPEPERHRLRLNAIRRTEGIRPPTTFPQEPGDITVPAHQTASILLDQRYLTNAYFHLLFSRGKNASITLNYAETLRNADGKKYNRNEIEGKTMIGRKDSIIANGAERQAFTTLSWRTYRYVQVNIRTADEPLVLHDVYGIATGYPFEKKSTVGTDDALLDSILSIGWRTARLCAVETYFDCPYYEQLQYAGDTRIQALVSYYNAGDDRLARKAIDLLDYSRNSEGITQSRYPSTQPQVIPPYSLAWIGMLQDFYRYRDDTDFVKGKLQGMRQVLHFFAQYQEEDGCLKDVPYWNFTDWAENSRRQWKFGVAPIDTEGHSAVLDLQLLLAFQAAAEMEEGIGDAYFAHNYQQKAEQLSVTIRHRYYDEARMLFADNADKKVFSEHANSLAILAGVVSGKEAQLLYRRMMDERGNLVQASIYFLYYVNRALGKAGLGNDYLQRLDIWKENIDLGLTTWGEDSNVENTRSDCHAWGASPNIEFYRTVLGIDSDAPSFAAVRIEPHLGTLTQADGTMPHPQGEISASYRKKGEKWMISISLPESVKGVFVWKGETYELHPGQFTKTLK